MKAGDDHVLRLLEKLARAGKAAAPEVAAAQLSRCCKRCALHARSFPLYHHLTKREPVPTFSECVRPVNVFICVYQLRMRETADSSRLKS